MLSVGSLFSGIGGFDLGFERAGFRVAWQCECDQFCRAVLRKHWPDVPKFNNVKNVIGAEPVDVICGGFPCQDISLAGLGAGIGASRSGLWKEFARVVGELRPSYVVVENVAFLAKRGLDVVIGDLSELGYDAEWDIIRASDFGAPHRRARIWIVAYPSANGTDEVVADTTGYGLEGSRTHNRIFDWSKWTQLANEGSTMRAWSHEPTMGRVADGIPNRVDRLRGLGNALVPSIAEWVARGIAA